MILAFVVLTALAQAPGVPAWTVSPQPLVVIDDDGTPAREFTRIAGVVRLSGNRIAVVNSGSQELRIFGARGQHLVTVGRSGGGPGEFRGMSLVGHSGDTLWLYDSPQQRLTTYVLASEPRLHGMLRVTATGDQPVSVSGRLSDGRWIVASLLSPRLDGPKGVHRLDASIGTIDATGDGVVTWLASGPATAFFVHDPTGRIEDSSVGATAFTPALRYTTSADQVWIGDSATDSLTVFAPNGAVFSVRLGLQARSPSAALIGRSRELELSRATRPSSRAYVNAKYSDEFLPKRLPVFGWIRPGPGGEVWVEQTAADPTLPNVYVVLDRQGRPRGRVSMPPATTLQEAGRDYVLLLAEDADGVQSVRLHGLMRR